MTQIINEHVFDIQKKINFKAIIVNSLNRCIDNITKILRILCTAINSAWHGVLGVHFNFKRCYFHALLTDFIDDKRSPVDVRFLYCIFKNLFQYRWERKKRYMNYVLNSAFECFRIRVTFITHQYPSTQYSLRLDFLNKKPLKASGQLTRNWLLFFSSIASNFITFISDVNIRIFVIA